jgi:outer membrane immunogenic protein
MVPEPAPVASWTGFYLGAGGGVGWANVDLNRRHCLLDDYGACDPYDDFHHDFNESSNGNIIGVVQGGFDWELAPSFVIGLGADGTFGDVLGVNRNNDDTVFDLHNRFDTSGSTMVDVYGRAGFAVTPNVLVFGLVGWSWLDINTDFRIRDIESDDTIFHHSDNRFADGLTFGGGLEWKVTDNVSIRGDYRFTDLNNFSNDGNFHCDVCEADFRDRNDINVNVQRVLFTLNWRFGGFGATTAAAY